MRAWQYSKASGGIEKNMKINPSATVPEAKPTQNLVEVIAVALNPVDYKPAEIPIIGHWIVKKPATPGLDLAGRIVTPAAGSSFKPGQLIFGISGNSPIAGGALRQFTTTESETTVPLPEEVNPVDAATIGVAGLTAYQSIVPNVKKGDRVFINGGSGGTGAFGIQIAKVMGCHVTTTCGPSNVELCKRLGADEVIDYRKTNVLEALKKSALKYDFVVDNIGYDLRLYWKCHEYTKPDTQFVMVGGTPSLGMVSERLRIKFIPAWLGGGQRKFSGFFPKANYEDLKIVGNWMKEGKVKAVIDEKFKFEDASKAYEKLKTGRAKGKIVVEVTANINKEPESF